MIFGIITSIVFVLAVCNVFVKKIVNTNLRKKLSTIHKIIGICFLLFILVHVVITWGLVKQRPTAMFAIGYIMTLSAMIIVLSFIFRKKLGKTWIVIHRAFAIVIFLCLIVHVSIGFSSLAEYKESVSGISISEVETAGIEDGNYIGECNVGYIYAKVEVIVKDGKITQITILEHRTEKGKPAEIIINKIVEQQQVQVDAITGATNSSKVIMKAVENAILIQ